MIMLLSIKSKINTQRAGIETQRAAPRARERGREAEEVIQEEEL